MPIEEDQKIIFFTDYVQKLEALISGVHCFQAFLQETIKLYENKKVMVESKNVWVLNPTDICNTGNILKSLFPNVKMALRILLSMAVTNRSGKRSFSVVWRV